MDMSFGGHHSTHYILWGLRLGLHAHWLLASGGFWQLCQLGRGSQGTCSPLPACLLGPSGGRRLRAEMLTPGREGGLSAKVLPALGRQQLPTSLSSCSETNEPANSTPSTGMTKPEGDLEQSNHFLSTQGQGGHSRVSQVEAQQGTQARQRDAGRTTCCSSNPPRGAIFASRLKHRLQSPAVAALS